MDINDNKIAFWAWQQDGEKMLEGRGWGGWLYIIEARILTSIGLVNIWIDWFLWIG